MNAIVIFSQFFGLVALICWILSVQSKDKIKILKMQSIANVFYAIQYFLLGYPATACMNLVSTSRNVCYYDSFKRGKENSITSLIFFSTLIIIVGIISFDGLLSIIPVILTLVYTYATWQKNPVLIRWSFIFAASIWIYYNLKVGAYVSLVGNFFELISGYIAVIRFDLKKK